MTQPARTVAPSGSPRQVGRRWLWLVLGIHVALGLAYAWATPIFEAPDEGYHFAVIRWLALGNGLPVQDPADPGDWEQEGSQPPLYYLLASALTPRIDDRAWSEAYVRNPFLRHTPGAAHNINAYRPGAEASADYQRVFRAALAVRLFSLALSVATVGLVYQLGLALSGGREWLALLAAGIAGLSPQVLFINAAINNDNLHMLLSTAALVIMLGIMRPAAPGLPVRIIGLGVLLGCAALTKISGLVLWPVAGLALAAGAYRRAAADAGGSGAAAHDARRAASASAPRLALHAFALFGVAALVCGWWYLRNYQLYGEWLGLNTMVAIAGVRQPTIGLWQLLAAEWYGFAVSFWGVFGAFTVLPPAWIHAFFGLLVLMAVAGGVISALSGRRLSLEGWLMAAFCALTLAGVVRWTLQTPASQGRLLFGAIAPLSVFMAGGILAAVRPLLAPRLRPAWPKRAALALLAALVFVAALTPFAFIAPRYAPPPRLADADLPPDLRYVRVAFGDGIELVGHSAPVPVQPGAVLPVTLYWRALAAMPNDYALALHLHGRDREIVRQLDTWPGGGMLPTTQWTPGAIYADTYYLEVDPAAAAPALLQLDVAFWLDDPAAQLPLRALEGESPQSITLRVGQMGPAQPEAVSPQHVDGSQLEHGIRLEGYDLGVNGAVSLTLYWSLDTGGRVPGDFTVMRHVVSEHGGPLNIADSQPLNSQWPTSAWVPGHTLVDTHLIALPPEVPPGRYNLHVGLYDPESGARLVAFRPDGTRWPDDVIVLPGFSKP